MKWSFGKSIEGLTQKTDAKSWPYAERTDGGVQICARSYAPSHTPNEFAPGYGGDTLFEPVASTGYVGRFKVQVLQPNDPAHPMAMHRRAKRKVYSVLFPEPELVAVSSTVKRVDPWPVMSDTYCTIEEYESSAPQWRTELREVTPTDCTTDDGIQIEDAPLLWREGTTASDVKFFAQFYCRRVMVFEGISHNGTAYSDTILRASAGTEPPAGAKWRMRPKPLMVDGGPCVDSDTRFEPFFYPATGCDFRRMMAAHWDGPAVILAEDTPFTVAFGHVEDAPDVESHLSGASIVCRFKDQVADFLDKVPAGIKHTLIVDANVHHVKRVTGTGQTNRFRFMAITGRATIIM